MMENDTPIRNLFQKYSSDISLEPGFLTRLESGLNALDLVLSQKKKESRRMKRTAFLAAMGGFVCGVILTLCYPLIFSTMESFLLSIPNLSDLNEQGTTLGIGIDIASYAFITLMCLSSTIFLYLFLLRRAGSTPTITPKDSGASIG